MQYLVTPDPTILEQYPDIEFPVVVAVNGRPFEGKQKIFIDMDNGLIKVDGVMDGVFRGTVVIERLWGNMKPV